MKTTMKMLAAAVSLGVALTAGAVGQTQPAGSLNELLNRVRSDAREASADNAARLREFQASTNSQQATLNTARSTLAQLERQATQLSADFEANQVRIDELDAELRQRQGAFGELFGAARQAAGEFAAMIDQSVTRPSSRVVRTRWKPCPTAGPCRLVRNSTSSRAVSSKR